MVFFSSNISGEHGELFCNIFGGKWGIFYVIYLRKIGDFLSNIFEGEMGDFFVIYLGVMGDFCLIFFGEHWGFLL